MPLPSSAQGAALKGLDASAAAALLTEAEAAEAAAARRNKLMLPYEADIWADLEPGFFLQVWESVGNCGAVC